MATEDAIVIISQGLSLVALWIVYMAWRWYRVEALRDDLFAVRDRLFDYAASGAMEFNDPAYRRLWLVLNALIHFASRITFGRFVFPSLITPLVQADVTGYMLWRQSLNKLPQGTREHLLQVHREIIFILARHLIRRTVLFMPIAAAVDLAQLLGRELPRFKNRCDRWIEDRMPALEDQALDAEQQRMRWHRRREHALAA